MCPLFYAPYFLPARQQALHVSRTCLKSGYLSRPRLVGRRVQCCGKYGASVVPFLVTAGLLSTMTPIMRDHCVLLGLRHLCSDDLWTVKSPGFTMRCSPPDIVSSISPAIWMTRSRLRVRCIGLSESGGVSMYQTLVPPAERTRGGRSLRAVR